tara:strand:+ start:32790 stop:33056 length:267 start_codon:yes stop_codon:yes gene_type:complete
MNKKLSKIEINNGNKKNRLYPFLKIQDAKRESKKLGSHFNHKEVNILSNGEQMFLEVKTIDNEIKIFDYLSEINSQCFSHLKNEFHKV